MKVCTKLSSATALVFSLLMGNSNAALVDNGTSMIDTGTGLQWLDLTETQGISWNDAAASTYVTIDGYVHATEAQVITLFTNAGFLTTDNTNDPANNPAAADLLAYLGCTQFCGTVNATGRGFADWDGTFTTRPNYHMSGLGAGAATTSLLTSDLDLIDATAGHFLVRAVPIPASKPDELSVGHKIFIPRNLLKTKKPMPRDFVYASKSKPKVRKTKATQKQKPGGDLTESEATELEFVIP